jgi:hypothetical protein
VRALFIPEGEAYSIELLAESQEERETLIKYWNNDRFSVSCEEWREMSDEANGKSDQQQA